MVTGMKVSKVLQEAGTALWVGGQFFGVIALPEAARAMPRRKDRQRVVRRGWDAWTPVSFAAIGAVAIGSLIEATTAPRGWERRAAAFRFAAATTGLLSTGLGAALGRAMRTHDWTSTTPVVRNDTGLPVVYVQPRETLRKGMVSVNILHGIAATGLVLGSAGASVPR